MLLKFYLPLLALHNAVRWLALAAALAAIFVAYSGWSGAKPAIAYSISLLLMLAGIPWWRPLLRLGF